AAAPRPCASAAAWGPQWSSKSHEDPAAGSRPDAGARDGGPSERVLRPAHRLGRHGRGVRPGAESAAQPHEVRGRACRSLRGAAPRAQRRPRDRRRVPLASERTVGAVRNRPRAPDRSVDGSGDRLAGPGRSHRARVPSLRSELHAARTRPRPVMAWAPVVRSLTVSSGAAQNPQPPAVAQPAQSLQELRLEGASIFTQDDVLWLLKLREGAPLPAPPDEIAKSLQERYQRHGYSEARGTAADHDG